MNSVDVVDFYRPITQLGVELWIDGGWGVDALLGEQTRPHEDLDIAIQQKDVPVLRHLLQARGYIDIKLEMPDLGILYWVIKTAERLMSMSSS